MSPHHAALTVLCSIILFIVALTQCLDAAVTTPFHPDEARWMNRAHFVTDLRDPFGPTWSDYYITRGQPPLASYLIGLGLLVQGRDLQTNAVWDFGYDTDWNTFNEAMADPGDLLAGRRTNAVVGALVVVAIFLLGCRLTGRFGAFCGAFYLSIHPLQIYLGSQALSDQLLSLMLALAFLAAFRLGQRPTLGNALMLGALLGLGGATKLSPLLLSIPLAALGGVSLIGQFRRRKSRSRYPPLDRLGTFLLIQPFVAFAVFVAVSPYLWPDPIRRTYYLFAFRRVEMVGQGTNWPEVAVANPIAAIGRIGLRLNEQYSTTSRIERWISDLTSMTFHPLGFDMLMVCIGGLLLAVMVINKGILTAHSLVAVMLASEVALIVLAMASDFYRYYLPIVLISAILVSVFADAVSIVICRVISRTVAGIRASATATIANEAAPRRVGPSTSQGA